MFFFSGRHIQEPWASGLEEIVPICPKENQKYCFLSWSNIGHILASTNLTSMRRQEIINVFTNLDQLFGTFHKPMFSMYGRYSHQLNILFHNNTKILATDNMLQTHPYDKIPLNLERSLLNVTHSCQSSDFEVSFGAKGTPSVFLIVSLVLYFVFFCS